MVYLYENEWVELCSSKMAYTHCPWCGKQHETVYHNQEDQPVFYQGGAYCAECYQQLANNAML